MASQRLHLWSVICFACRLNSSISVEMESYIQRLMLVRYLCVRKTKNIGWNTKTIYGLKWV